MADASATAEMRGSMIAHMLVMGGRLRTSAAMHESARKKSKRDSRANTRRQAPSRAAEAARTAQFRYSSEFVSTLPIIDLNSAMVVKFRVLAALIVVVVREVAMGESSTYSYALAFPETPRRARAQVWPTRHPPVRRYLWLLRRRRRARQHAPHGVRAAGAERERNPLS